jgi:PEP-CTERM motif
MKRMPAFLVVGVAAVSLLLGMASPAAASSITLDDPVILASLLCGGSITVGDKLFDEFSYSSTGDMPKAHKVKVIPIQDGDGNFGLRFQGGFVDFYGDGPSDAQISYRVTVLDPLFLISDVHLAGNPDVIAKDCHKSHKCKEYGQISVTETFLTDDPFTELSIYDVEPGSRQLVDWALLAEPVQTLHVQNDIMALADHRGTVAKLWFVDQTFSQVAVPEPSTISLLTIGIALIWGLRRRLPHGA